MLWSGNYLITWDQLMNDGNILIPQRWLTNENLCRHPHSSSSHGSLARYVKLRLAHAPGTFSPPPWVSDPDMHHGTSVTHVPRCMLGLLISGFLWSQWRGKRSRYSRRTRNPQFDISSKRPMGILRCNTMPLSVLRTTNLAAMITSTRITLYASLFCDLSGITGKSTRQITAK